MLPDELVKYILSFINVETLKKLELFKKYGKDVLQIRFPDKKRSILQGTYQNIQQLCFTCENPLNNCYILTLCPNCNIYSKEIYNTPLFCIECVPISDELRSKYCKIKGLLLKECNFCEKRIIFYRIDTKMNNFEKNEKNKYF
jgi:hypothetical protein